VLRAPDHLVLHRPARSRPGPGADVEGVSPVPAQMWAGVSPSPARIKSTADAQTPVRRTAAAAAPRRTWAAPTNARVSRDSRAPGSVWRAL
jgi:hypothetical protein